MVEIAQIQLVHSLRRAVTKQVGGRFRKGQGFRYAGFGQGPEHVGPFTGVLFNRDHVVYRTGS
jgi:hypothetical protein